MAGWVSGVFPRVVAADRDPQPPRYPVGLDVDPAHGDHVQLAEPLGDLAGIDLAGAFPGAPGVDQRGVAEEGFAVLEQMGAVKAQERR